MKQSDKVTPKNNEKICIIPQNEILCKQQSRVFNEHKLLKKLLPDNQNLAISWLMYKHNDAPLVKSELLSTLIYIYKGSADLIGSNKKLTTDDILLIPKNYKYGFVNVGQEGLSAIKIQFNQQELRCDDLKIHQYKSYPLTFEGLMLHNQLCLKQTLNNDFFKLLIGNNLSNPTKRHCFLDCVQVFSDYFQIMMFSREATCQDNTYTPLFLQHLHEEFGHNELLAHRKIKHEIKDPILLASSSWFCYQMFVLDNIEKTALVHLILETGGSYYGTLAKQKAGDDVSSNYFDIHSEGDDEHAEMGAKLLKGHDSLTYKRLHQVIDKGWEMLNIMLNRIAFLVNESH